VPVVPGLARFRHIMGINETLGRTSFLARATLDDVLDEEGKFDLDKARQTGGIHAIKRLRIRTNTRRYKDGTEDVTVTHEVELRDKNSSVELMGRHLGLWDDDEDPREVLERLLGIPKSQLPAKADALVHPISEDEEDERPAS
jgi:hypothetical protein